MSYELSDRQRSLKAQFKDERGYWSEALEQFLFLDPEFFEQYMAFSGHPWRDGVLEPRVQELILIALHATPPILDEGGTRLHIGRALEEGATVPEIMEVFELISPNGIHSVREAVPILAEEAELPEPDQAEAAEMDRLRREFEEERDYWSELWDQVMRLDLDFFRDVKETFAFAETDPVLDPKVKELIWISIDVTLTHFYEPGLRIHINAAVKQGATPEEIMEVFELANDFGIATLKMGVPLLIQEARERDIPLDR